MSPSTRPASGCPIAQSSRAVAETRAAPGPPGMRRRSATALGLPVPVGMVVEVRVPAADIGAPESGGDRGDDVAPEHRDHHYVLDQEVVHPDVVGRSLDGIHLGLRGLPEPVVLLVPPAGDVPAGPLVLLRR